MKNTLQDFQEWQARGPGRSVSIKIQNCIGRDGSETDIWVWDHMFQAGQYVQSVDEIDLEAVKEKEEREVLRKLHVKYGAQV